MALNTTANKEGFKMHKELCLLLQLTYNIIIRVSKTEKFVFLITQTSCRTIEVYGHSEKAYFIVFMCSLSF